MSHQATTNPTMAANALSASNIPARLASRSRTSPWDTHHRLHLQDFVLSRAKTISVSHGIRTHRSKRMTRGRVPFFVCVLTSR